MKKNIGKNALIIALVITLIGNTLQVPGTTIQVAAQQINTDDSDAGGEKTDVNYNALENDTEEQSSEKQELLYIGQSVNMQDFPGLNDSDSTYNTPIMLTSDSQVRLFAGWGIADDTNKDSENDEVNWQYSYIGGCGLEEESDIDIPKCPYEGVLTWSILRGEEGIAPGTRNLMNDEDDWADFETVQSAPFFTIEEDKDENSNFFGSLAVTANGWEEDDHYDYYIRATFQYRKEQAEYTAITTVPVSVMITVEEEEASTIEQSEIVIPTEVDEETDEELSTAEQGENVAETEEQNDVSGQEIQIKEELETENSDIETEAADEEQQESITASETENTDAEPEQSTTTEPVISKLILNKTSATMNPGDTLKLSATIVPEGLNLNVNWSGNNNDVATIDSAGNITALSEGQTEITAECGGKTARVMITVIKTDAEKNNDRPKDEEGNIIAITDEIWLAGFEKESDELVYTGGKVTQNLRIYHKGTILREKTDYVLTYKNNVNAAAYNSTKAPSVTVTMKGQYTGSRTLYFTIAPRDINEDNLQGYEQVIRYSKKLKLPAPTIYFGDKKLVSGKDFICDYSSLPDKYTEGDSYEEGVSYEYNVKGIGNFTGSFIMKLAVVKDKNADFGNAVVVLDKKQYEYHGNALSVADVGITSVKLGEKVLDASLYEYKVDAEGVGNGYVTVYPSDAGRNEGYRGMKKLKIKVVGDRNIKDTEIGSSWQDTIIFSQKKLDYSGGICQEKTGVLIFGKENSSEPLVEGVDYTVKYSNNKKAGTATVIFTGIGRYNGSIKKTYRIVPNTELYIKWHNTKDNGTPVVAYMKGGAIPEFDLMELPEGEASYVLENKKDYTISVRNNKKPGIMTCEIIGKGNYKGYRSVTEIEVTAADIGQGTIEVKDKQFSNSPNAWKSAVTIKDVNGKKLKAGTDYDRQMTYSYAGMAEGLVPKAGTVVYVTASGINNYAGSTITGSYRIYSTSLSKLTILIDSQEYTGKEIELSKDDIHVYAAKSDVNKGIEIAENCYEIVGYSNNVKAGTAKVTLRGLGDYGGTKVCSFKITKKEYRNIRVTKIVLDETSITLGTGNSRQLTATVLPEDASNKTVIWTSSNNKVATVSTEGIVTAKQSGTVTITATSQDTGKKASCKVEAVIIPVTSFSLNTTEVKQCEGTWYQLNATEIQPAGASYDTIEWESTNPEIASVDENGKVSLNKAGMAVIKAYADERRFVRKCLVIVNSKEEETTPEGTYLTPQMFRTSNEDDDTEAFNDAVKNMSENCNTVYIPAGTYKIDAETSIRLRSNMNFVMSPDAVLQAVDNSGKGYNVIYVNGISNVTISGGQIIGERYGHDGTEGEWGMGIGIYDSTNINVADVNISNCWGDGIYIGSEHEEDAGAGCNQISVTNCNLFNNRRNNLSLVCADYVTIDSCTFNDANGTAPEYGIDIEPNIYSNPCEHITISNSTFSGNAQASIGIVTSANDVTISGCTLNGNFINYAGTNVTISNSIINAKMYARIGVSLVDGTKINDGGEEEDLLIATFSAAKGSYTIGEYEIDDSNLMVCKMIDDNDSPSGKALYLKRQSNGTKETGYYLELSELTENGDSVLEKGAAYRFEYVMKGSGQWGIKTSQTCWYPCAPVSDKFSTGITTYTADSAKSCKLILYAVDKTKDMYLEIDSIKIYKVR